MRACGDSVPPSLRPACLAARRSSSVLMSCQWTPAAFDRLLVCPGTPRARGLRAATGPHVHTAADPPPSFHRHAHSASAATSSCLIFIGILIEQIACMDMAAWKTARTKPAGYTNSICKEKWNPANTNLVPVLKNLESVHSDSGLGHNDWTFFALLPCLEKRTGGRKSRRCSRPAIAGALQTRHADPIPPPALSAHFAWPASAPPAGLLPRGRWSP